MATVKSMKTAWALRRRQRTSYRLVQVKTSAPMQPVHGLFGPQTTSREWRPFLPVDRPMTVD